MVAAEDLDVASGRTYRRLVIDRDDLQVAFDLHPALTVIAASSRQASTLIELFATAHGVAQPGVHLEYLDEVGRSVLAFRPYGAKPRRIDLQSGALLPDDVAMVDGPDPAGHLGEQDDDSLRRLAALPQSSLWAAAERVARAEMSRDARLGEMGLVDGGVATPPRRRGNRTARRRLKALADALAELDSAESDWRSLAGETPVHKAVAARPLVEAVADVRDTTRSVLAVAHPTDEGVQRRPRRRRAAVRTVAEPDLADRATAVVADLLRRPGRPLVLSLVAEAVDAAEAVTILDVLAGVPSVGQVIVVSDSEEVTDWGQLESITSRASFLDLRPRELGPDDASL